MRTIQLTNSDLQPSADALEGHSLDESHYDRLIEDSTTVLKPDGTPLLIYQDGPGSIRPDGVVYVADDWSWDINDVPFFPADFLFDDRAPEARGSANGQPLVLPEYVYEQERHDTLHDLMRSLVAHGVPLDGALETCYAANQAKCRPPLEKDEKLEKFLRRAYAQKDRADFTRSPKTGWHLAGCLFEVGLPVEVILVAVRSIDPTFDPETTE